MQRDVKRVAKYGESIQTGFHCAYQAARYVPYDTPDLFRQRPARRNPGVDIGPEQRRPLNVDPVQHLFDRVPQRTLAHQGSLLTDAVYPAHSCCLRCHGHLTKSVALSAIAETWAVAVQKRIKRRAISRETTDSTRKPRARGRVTSGRRLCSAPSSFRRFPSTNGPRISPNTSGGRG